MTSLPAEQMLGLLEVHGGYELALDLDATMSTVSAQPSYEYPMVGWRADGRGAVREAYRRMMIGYLPRVESSTVRAVGCTGNTLFREGVTVLRFPAGPIACRTITVITFEGDLVSGERMYTDQRLTAVCAEAFGDDFGEVPGVSRL
jgi:hypothetical protein